MKDARTYIFVMWGATLGDFIDIFIVFLIKTNVFIPY